ASLALRSPHLPEAALLVAKRGEPLPSSFGAGAEDGADERPDLRLVRRNLAGGALQERAPGAKQAIVADPHHGREGHEPVRARAARPCRGEVRAEAVSPLAEVTRRPLLAQVALDGSLAGKRAPRKRVRRHRRQEILDLAPDGLLEEV